MRKSPLIVAAAATAAACALAAVAQPSPTTKPGAGNASDVATTAPTTQEVLQRVSYGIGLQTGKQMKDADVQIDVASMTAGITDALSGKEPRYNDADLKAAFAVFQQQMVDKEQAKAAKSESDNKAFLEANKAKANVQTTPSGLQYQILTQGTGPKPKPTDTVKVHYTGTLVDGTKFDSSVDRGQPIEFPLDQVIPGWTEGIQLMNVGGKAKLFIPSDLAYGPMGRPPVIPANAVLIFDVELLGTTPAATQPDAAMPGGMSSTTRPAMQ